jgi:hypothetical protein
MHSAQIVAVTCLFAAGAVTAAAQAYRPVVTMMVTVPDGQTRKIAVAESDLRTMPVNGRDYALRPTMMDDKGSRVVITLFDMGGASGPTRELGAVEVLDGGPLVTMKTDPAFKVRVTNVAKPPLTTS